MKKILFLIMLAFISCGRNAGDFTAEEKALINRTAAGIESMVPSGTMRVLTIADPADNEVLRTPSSNLSKKALQSKDYASLCSLMVATVTHPSQDGVGIAGPQVGLNRRVVAVQRFDKEGEPFEVYPNIRITWASDSLAAGPEGCLSVPDRREDVMRSTEIEIEYADPAKGYEIVREKVSDFTAVIFQHEIDHLEGIIYTDRVLM
jgi:peptide deformylase